MKLILLTLSIISAICCESQGYAVSAIPDSLMNGANSVKRMEEYHIIIKSPEKVLIRHKYAITILNENGASEAEYVNIYDPLDALSDISGSLFDAGGKKLRSVRKKDISDESMTDGFSLMQDDRIKKHNFNWRQYPYTIEYEDQEQLKGTLNLPLWSPMEAIDNSVQQSKLVVEFPVGYRLRYKCLNNMPAPSESANGGNTVYTWVINNLKSLPDEAFRPPFIDIAPAVLLAASDFSIGGYKGNMDDWQSFGKFQLALNTGRDVLPPDVKKMVHFITDQLSTKKAKVEALYHYMQANTHYVSIQLGVGGWQPFDATYVAQKKFGDCKALSNYMVSLLKEAGIKANYVLISAGAGRKGLQEDFPANTFNHVITCVPDTKDTIWLECTSQSIAAGFLGNFTDNRNALLIDDDGGHIVHTPVYSVRDNRQLRHVTAVIDADGNMQAKVVTRFTGLQQELQHALIHEYSQEERIKYLNKVISLPTYQVTSSDYQEFADRIPVIAETLQINASNFATISGKRLFISPNFFNKSQSKSSVSEKRKFPVILSFAYQDIDTIKITIPPGYKVESMPASTNISGPSGEFQIRFNILSETEIEMVRNRINNVSVLPPEEYNQFVQYCNDIYKADRSRIVFVKAAE